MKQDEMLYYYYHKQKQTKIAVKKQKELLNQNI